MSSDLFEKASRQKLRFASPLGGQGLSVEELWDLPINPPPRRGAVANLADIARDLNRQLKESSNDDLPFLSNTKKADATTQLAFDIVKHVVETKKAEAEKAAEKASDAGKKQQILALIAAKEAEQLGGQSLEELRKLAADL
jgi:hypothetical protein